MEKKDKKILNLIQCEFPIASNPFEIIGEKTGIPEKEVISRIKRMKEKKIIRRIGSTLNAGRMGMKSTLVTVHVPAQQTGKTARIISAYGNVTHNYMRNHYFNIWFTVTAQSKSGIAKILKAIKRKAEITEMIELPAVKLFKREVVFKF